jgi:glutamate formiminotransferase
LEPLVECVPNFSEGRDAAIIERIVAAVSQVPQVAVLDLHSDAGHNRSVLTFVGPPNAVQEAAVRLVGEAARWIDLNVHCGAHPRIGATDVVPFVPISAVSMDKCVQIAHAAGRDIFQRFAVPVYFYEAAALRPEHRALEDIRRGQFEYLREAVKTDVARRPDIGGPLLNETAGATAVGSRKFLVAFNVNLNTSDVNVARAIARKVRASNGGLPALKAIGLRVDVPRERAQVAMNLCNFEQTAIPAAYQAVVQEAHTLGASVASSELVGLAPARAFAGASMAELSLPSTASDQIFERRLAKHFPAFGGEAFA